MFTFATPPPLNLQVEVLLATHDEDWGEGKEKCRRSPSSYPQGVPSIQTAKVTFSGGKKVKSNLSPPGTATPFLRWGFQSKGLSAFVSGPLWQWTKLREAITKSSNFEPISLTVSDQCQWKVSPDICESTSAPCNCIEERPEWRKLSPVSSRPRNLLQLTRN